MAPDRLPRATLEQKIQILDFYHQSNRPQSETVDRYKNQLSISTSSFSEWLKNEEDLRARLSHADSAFTKQSRRKVKFKYEKINRAMDLLVQQKLERGEPINEPILREHWSIYAHQFGVEDPKRLVGFSHGWLSQFKKRHGLNKKRMGGGPGDGDGNKSGSADGSPDSANATNSANGEVYDSAFGTDPSSTTNAGDDHDNGSADFSGATTAATSYDLMNPHPPSASNSNQFRSSHHHPQQSQQQPGLGYGNHMNFSNYQMYQQQSPSVQPNGTALPLEYDFRTQYPKDPQPGHVKPSRSQPPHPQLHQPHQVGAGKSSTGGSGAAGRVTSRSEVDFASNMSGADIERFIYMFADRYFHENASNYPQTMKVFQEFKTTFLNERIQQARSSTQSSQIVHSQGGRPSPSQTSAIDEFFFRNGGLPQPQSAGHDQEDGALMNSNGVNKWKK
ncbi:hypothetical protein CANTEDRAFT_130646 [Yamadazyma tenuis ATCC 10573]|uniref:HTH CENPB-type domain-containing protein n=1 Tax=Candida tenuis (strain ATCC 10573 / BCRC 21748 / CBS 615 / JCM 9827 / NBRC 10315 / NRRL Y-1498 / VKM Y-70) TaxID=590646 RepID=G3B527_CANTC|nr:uncharacterized protein CANTEDRAFT_130646 [Yamadazyma tenuis ATCC 10573]EGV63120.1 hypothetical protein CANTEDRAFT_130646 [Yamadazyma tenuis ATCC 10573]